MAFTLPTFNLHVNIWRHALDPLADPPSGTARANLANGKRTAVFNSVAIDPALQDWEQFGEQQLLCPKGTDIRGFNMTGGGDWFTIDEAPGVIYVIKWVQYAGLGFANQHLLCWVNQRDLVTGPLP